MHTLDSRLASHFSNPACRWTLFHHAFTILLQNARHQASPGCTLNMEVSIAMEVPNNGWFLLENPIYKWMMTGGTPVSTYPTDLPMVSYAMSNSFLHWC